jgi:hypothetical protein
LWLEAWLKPALHARSPKFKPQYSQERKKRKGKKNKDVLSHEPWNSNLGNQKYGTGWAVVAVL